MANFNTHFEVAGVASAVVSATLLSMGVVTQTQAIMAFSLGILGGLMPDIDASNSTAIDIAFTVISLLITALVVFMSMATYSLVEMLILAGVVFIMVRFGILEELRNKSRHRGMFHSIPVAMIWGVITAILMNRFFELNSLISWVYGIMMSFGYIIHLILDEIYSVDLRNRRLKKSSGTAFKFFMLKNSEQKMQTFLVYMLLFGLFYIAPDTTLIKETLFSHNAWINFKDVLLPYDGKWFFHK